MTDTTTIDDTGASDDDAQVAPASSIPRWRRGTVLSDGSRLVWWREVLLVLIVDIVYESIRNVSAANPARAYANAERLIGWQRAIGMFHERQMQIWALDVTPLIVAANYFYGSVYIAATLFGLFFLYRRFPDDYPLWRSTLLIGTLLGLIGFATFPLMPPRLLDSMGGASYGFVDTLVKYPTFWSFNSEGMKTISNQFAAMPSLHCGWAMWGTAVFLPRVRSWWAKSLAVLYPIVTIIVVIITGNHYWLDAVGGAVIFLAGYGLARALQGFLARTRQRVGEGARVIASR
ncbi:MAG: phosphatase PAP2 family protein [Acidobacteria bacterium]|nr:phosphatase PAP2 family protein [Acidobacteriota bacterium]